ncbi:MAG: hypothetical protein M3Q75_10415, partial [Gemmatimonadota bacterium]|nr:hypothetical protein [Gemmatimonadota bacterium]
LVPVGEVYAKLVLRQPEGLVGLSAVRVRLLRAGADPLVGTTEFDGTIVFSEAPIGRYRLELDPEQAKRLGMQLKEPVEILVTAEGGKDIEAEVIFDESRVADPDATVAEEAGGTVQ